jgi:hypothetical protein
MAAGGVNSALHCGFSGMKDIQGNRFDEIIYYSQQLLLAILHLTVTFLRVLPQIIT